MINSSTGKACPRLIEDTPMRCSGCGADHPDDRRYCTSCGAPLLTLCPVCGSTNPPFARFCGSCGQGLDIAPAFAADREPGDTAERRQLTVMFCDLVGSTALSAALDPEDLRDVLAAYHATATETVTRYGGTVAKYLGDGVLVHFGYPQAGEDDAERAVRAGLALVPAITALDPGPSVRLAVRIGIATGIVVVEDGHGTGAAHDRSIIGETPNLAARLQTLAQPGTVLISDDTRRLIGNLFQCTDLGPTTIKGFARAVRVWRVDRERRTESRFVALHGGRVTPLIGRTAEQALLDRLWRSASSGRGRVALITGEAGIGKSRLVRTLENKVETERRQSLLRYCCSPTHRASALYPFIDQIERAAGMEADDTAERRMHRLRALLRRTDAIADTALPLFAALLSIPAHGAYHPPDLPPSRLRQRFLDALMALLVVQTHDHPRLIVFEDAHWIDPTSADLLERLVGRITELPGLLVVTARPEFSPTWQTAPGVSTLRLDRLERSESADLVLRHAGGKALPPAILNGILTRADGVPLFLEELTHAVIESGHLAERGGHYESVGPALTDVIPATLRDSLTARLDRLGWVKEVAQIGAVIGREFPHDLLARVAGLSDEALSAALERLVASGLVFQDGAPPEAVYRFKHALIQDAAYGSILKGRRRLLHGRIARTIRTQFPVTADHEPELLARHFTEAGQTEDAIEYWYRAGCRATERSANLEAIDHLSHGLRLLGKSPDDDPVHAERRRAYLVALGVPLIAIKGYAAPEVEHVYDEARILCERSGDDERLFPVLRGLWNCHLDRGTLPVALSLARRLVDAAERADDDALRALALRALGTTHLFRGDFHGAHEALAAGIVVHTAHPNRTNVHLHGEEPGIICRIYIGWTLACLGRPKTALRITEEGLAMARRLGFPLTLAFAESILAGLHLLRRDPAAIFRHAEAILALSFEQGFVFWSAHGHIMRGWSLAATGEVDQGVAEIRRGIDAWKATGASLLHSFHNGLLAEALGMAGKPEEGLAVLAEASSNSAVTDEYWFEARLRTIEADLLLACGASEDIVHAALARALDVAMRQDAVLWALPAATTKLRLSLGTPDAAEIRALLTTLLDRFTEGADLDQAREARAVLAIGG